MERAKIILLYFVLPIFGFAGYVVSQVGIDQLNWALWLTGLIVAAVLVLINTRRQEDARDDIRRQDEDWDGYYTMQQSERLHHRHPD